MLRVWLMAMVLSGCFITQDGIDNRFDDQPVETDTDTDTDSDTDTDADTDTDSDTDTDTDSDTDTDTDTDTDPDPVGWPSGGPGVPTSTFLPTQVVVKSTGDKISGR